MEDSFKLKIRRDIREARVCGLVVGKGGPKLEASKKENCTPVDLTNAHRLPMAPDNASPAVFAPRFDCQAMPDLEVASLPGDMMQKGRTSGDQSETSAAAGQQMNRWVSDTDRRKTAAFALIEHKEHTKYEAKEHHLPLVRQGRA